jgi:hypothetical protein
MVTVVLEEGEFRIQEMGSKNLRAGVAGTQSKVAAE